ncbi:DUF6607 family protein [Ekhidna sp.]
MKQIITTLLCLIALLGHAQKKKKQDIESILGMCGCYEISFNFAETFAEEKSYEYHDNYYSGGLEWIFPVINEKDKIVLQHLLVIGDTMIIKHWRQDWLFENQDVYLYDKNNTWNYKQLSANQVKGQWTQKVFQVDDSPRYEGSATWVHYDGKHYWESQADAPLPRREFSKRSDYNVMVRKNRHEITEFGWIHEQDNQKVMREESDRRLASEKGLNTYSKVEDSQCSTAVAWWNENHKYWADVRSIWDEIFASKKQLSLNMKVDDKIMFMRLFELGDQMKGENYSESTSKTEIRKVIQMHLSEKGDTQLASGR